MIMIKYSWNDITKVASVEAKWDHQYLSAALASLLQVQQLISTLPWSHTSVPATTTNNSRKGGWGSQLAGASGRDQPNLQSELPLGSQRMRTTPWEEQWLDLTLQCLSDTPRPFQDKSAEELRQVAMDIPLPEGSLCFLPCDGPWSLHIWWWGEEMPPRGPCSWTLGS